MKSNNFRIPAVFVFLIVLMFFSTGILAATHNIHLSAETLPNGQFAYKMLSHTSSEGTTPTYPAEATIPGPTVFVKKGDVLNVSLTNNTAINVGLTPGGIEATPGDTKDFSYTADSVGTFPYYDAGSHLLGLFGALVVDKTDDTVQSLVEEDGALKTVSKSEVTKEFVMFMVGSTFWGTEIKNNTQTPLWTNPTLGALKDDVVRFHVLAVGPGHTFHLHGHRWPDETNFTGMNVNPNVIDVKLMPTGGASHSFTVRAGTGVGTGYWQYHCHLVSHMESGMAGKFHACLSGCLPMIAHGGVSGLKVVCGRVSASRTSAIQTLV